MVIKSRNVKKREAEEKRIKKGGEKKPARKKTSSSAQSTGGFRTSNGKLVEGSGTGKFTSAKSIEDTERINRETSFKPAKKKKTFESDSLTGGKGTTTRKTTPGGTQVTTTLLSEEDLGLDSSDVGQSENQVDVEQEESDEDKDLNFSQKLEKDLGGFDAVKQRINEAFIGGALALGLGAIGGKILTLGGKFLKGTKVGVNIATKVETAAKLTKVTKNGAKFNNLEDIVSKGPSVTKAAAGGRVRSTTRIKTNSKTARKKAGILKSVTTPLKWGLTALGTLSGFAFAGQFLATQTYNDSADAIDGLKFAMSAARRDEDDEEAERLGEVFDDTYDAWEETEGLGIFNYPKAANLKIQSAKEVRESMRRQIAKKKERQAKTIGNLEEEEQLAAVSEPKWVQTENGKYKPNLRNPLWKKENGKNVWTGD
tara:strand:- start:951 stop:2228 length:1278 start_codon:yes stop_codon:yes gene_type:complete